MLTRRFPYFCTLCVFFVTALCGLAAGQNTAPETNVGQTSVTLTASVTLAQGGAPTSVAVVTKGAPNLDFNEVSDTCVNGSFQAGQFCLVKYTFTPQSAGERLGGIVVKDGSGNVLATSYVAGIGDAPLGLFSAPTATWTASGFSNPRGISVDGFGNLYVADTSNNQIKEIPVSGGAPQVVASFTFDNASETAGATAVDGAGNLYAISEPENELYERINGVMQPIAGVTNCDDNLEVDGAGNLYTSNKSTAEIYKIAAGTHAVSTVFSGQSGSRFIGMAVDPAGNLFVADYKNNVLYKLAAGASTLTPLVNQDGNLDGPHSVALDAAGNIYVGNLNSASGDILRYAAGTLAETTLPAVGTASMAIDGQGNIYTILNDTQTVAEYSRNAAPTAEFGATVYGATNLAASAGDTEFENDGNTGLNITSYAGSGSFGTDGTGNTCVTGTMNAGTTCEIGASFAPVGTGALSGKVTLTDNNLGVAGTQQVLNVAGEATAAVLTVTASSPTAIAGVVPPVTASYSGFVLTDGIGSLTSAPVCTTTQTVGTVAGEAFTTACSGGAAANYSFAYVNGGGTVQALPSATPAPTTVVGDESGAQTVYVSFNAPGTLGSISVVTGGVTGLDFNPGAYTGADACTAGQAYAAGAACAVAYTFTPKAAGERLGAVLLKDGSGNLLGTTFLSGEGTGAVVAYLGAAPAPYATAGQGTVVQVAMDVKGNLFYGNNSGGLSELPANGDGTYAAAQTVIASGFPTNNFLHGAGFDGAGNLYLGDNGHSAVYRVAMLNGVASGGVQTIEGFGTEHPQALAADAGGNVYVAACCTGTVYRIAPGATTATLIATRLPGGSDPEGMVVDGAGNVWMAGASQSNSLIEIASPASGSPVVSMHAVASGSPWALGMDAGGDMYYTDGSSASTTIFRIPNGSGGLEFGNGAVVATAVNNPREIEFDPEGNMVVSSTPGDVYVYEQQSPAGQTYPTTAVGSHSAPQAQTVMNIGNAPLTFGTVTYDPNFPNYNSTCGTGSVATGGGCSLVTRFVPTTGGNPINGVLTINDNGVNEPAAQTMAQSGVANQQPQTISFTLATPVTYAGQTITLNGTATSGLAVSYTLSAGAPATVNGSSLTISGIGTFTVTASQAGDEEWAAATSVPQTLEVDPEAQTISFPAPATPVMVNGTATLGATASSGETVTYTVTAGTAGINGSTVNYTNSGTVTITASAGAIGDYAAAAPVSETVQVSAEPISYAAPTTNVTQASGPQVAYVNFTNGGTLAAIGVVTQGAVNQDFTAATTAAADACTVGEVYSAGQACEVDYTFAPQSAGTREGGVVLTDGSGNVLGTSYLGGLGEAPLGLFSSPVATRTVTSNISTPRGLSVDGNGNVYFANTGNGTLEEIPAGTTNVVTVVTTAIGTGATAVDGAGNLYLADQAQSTIFQVVNGGLSPIVTHISPDDNLEIDAAGNLYTSDYNNGAIYKIDAGTHIQHTLLAGGAGHRFIGMHVDPAGNIFAADFYNNTLYELPAGGSALVTLASGAPLYQPHSVAVDPAGNVYVGNLSGGGIMRYAAGTWQETTLPAAGTTSLAIDGQGNIYANVSENAIAVYARNLSPTVAFAATTYGQTSAGAPGEPIEFENDGNLGLAISSYAANSSFGANGTGNTCGTGTLNSGATCEIAASFTPSAASAFSGALTIADNNLNQSANQTVNLNGSGVAAAITVTAASATITYGQSVPTITGTVTSGALVGGDTLASIGVSCSAAGTPGNAGSYATSCTGAPANYTVNYVGGTLTIGQAGITVTAASPTIIYGQAVPAIAGTVTAGALVGTDTLGGIGVTCAASGTPGNAGTYATSCAGAPTNYAVSFVGGTLTINQAPITVTAGSATITYGQSVPAITGTVTTGALVGADTLGGIGMNCAASGTPGNAGTYATSCAGAPANYAVSYVGGTLTINRAPITVTAASATITYGQAVPAISGTATSGALVGTDTLGGIGVTCAASGTPGNAGTYATSCAGTPANYAVNYVGGTLTINQALITVTAASATITYGQSVPAISGTVTSGALVGTDTLGGIGVTCAASGTPGNAGTYATSCAGTPANYAVSYVGGALTINKAGITVTAASPTITFGQAVPAIAGSVTSGSLVGADTLTSIGVTCAAAGTPVDAGTYATGCMGNPANYAVSYVGGLLTIVRAPQAISFATIGDQVFNGVPYATPLGATASSGLAVTYTVTGPATLGGANGNILTINAPGTVTVTVTQAGSNDYLAAPSVVQTFQTRLGLAYGFYATATGCQSLVMAGNVRMDSFDSSLGAFPAGLQQSGGNLGTNGTLTLAGNAEIYGALFDPHGNTRDSDCDRNPQASLVMHGDHDHDDVAVSGGIVSLPAALVFPAPAAAAVAPPTTQQMLGDECGQFAGCAQVGRSHVALAPGQYGNLTMDDNLTVDLSAGTYNINSLRLGQNTVLHIASGPVIINLAGAGVHDDAFDSHAGTVDNALGPKNLVILYGGRNDIELSGSSAGNNGEDHCDGDHDGDDRNCGPSGGLQAIIYAPFANVTLSGNTVFSGTIVGYTITAEGDVTVHYDRSLAGTAAFSGGVAPPACTSGDGDHDRDDSNACGGDSGDGNGWGQGYGDDHGHGGGGHS